MGSLGDDIGSAGDEAWSLSDEDFIEFLAILSTMIWRNELEREFSRGVLRSRLNSTKAIRSTPISSGKDDDSAVFGNDSI